MRMEGRRGAAHRPAGPASFSVLSTSPFRMNSRKIPIPKALLGGKIYENKCSLHSGLRFGPSFIHQLWFHFWPIVVSSPSPTSHALVSIHSLDCQGNVSPSEAFQLQPMEVCNLDCILPQAWCTPGSGSLS